MLGRDSCRRDFYLCAQGTKYNQTMAKCVCLVCCLFCPRNQRTSGFSHDEEERTISSVLRVVFLHVGLI